MIPARWASSRFPGKPLADLGGRPVLVRVWERCREAVNDEQIIVATDDDRIAQTLHEFGARIAMTSAGCLTGTDRVAEVAQSHAAGWYINVQGDEPFVEPTAITSLIEEARLAGPEVAAINAMTAIQTEEDFRSPTVPKVVSRPDGRLLYISRAAIPTNKALTFVHARRQVGLYAFRPEALQVFASQRTKTPLETVEDVEILRLLELGLSVQMIDVPSAGPAVDTPDDLERARTYLQELEAP